MKSTVTEKTGIFSTLLPEMHGQAVSKVRLSLMAPPPVTSAADISNSGFHAHRDTQLRTQPVTVKCIFLTEHESFFIIIPETQQYLHCISIVSGTVGD